MKGPVLTAGIVAGLAVGLVYTLSPLSVICLPIIVALTVWTARDLTADERRWFYALIAIAVAARLIVISGLFLSSSQTRPFEVFFGDELLFKNRSLWMRNIGLGVPISPADVIYAYEDVGESSYLQMLALIQALVGKAPYGVHVFNATCYLAGALLLFRIAREAFGRVGAFSGLAVLVFTPSLFMWSISAIKEPIYMLAACLEFVCALAAARASTWRARVSWLVGVAAFVVVLDSIRRGGAFVPAVGVAGGYLFGYVLPRPKLLLATVTFLPVLIAAALMIAPIQNRVLTALRTGAYYHSGHVLSAGYSYQALSGDYYRDGLKIFTMPVHDIVDYVFRSYVAYVTEPVPWRIESRALLAYLPEQMFWMLLLALAPFGIYAGARRDVMLTALLVAHAVAGATIVAISSGNIGTLIRHRGLIMPYVAWLAGLGLYQLVKLTVTPSPVLSPGGLEAHGRS